MSDEPTHMPMTEEKPKKAPTLYIIVGIKAVKGIAALLLAWVTYALSDNNLPEEFRKLLERAREYDRRHNQPDCELESKRQEILRLAESLGVKIDFV